MSMFMSIGTTLQDMSCTHDALPRAASSPAPRGAERALAAALRRLATAELRWAAHLEQRFQLASTAS
jgi:hypothetical protein